MHSFLKLLIVTVCFSAVFINPLSIEAATITVRQDGSGDYLTITDAVAAADPNDTIEVGPGTYKEEVWVEKSLKIISQQGSNFTIVDGENVRRCFRFIGAIIAELDGFTLQFGYGNNGGALRADLGADLVVRNCVIRNNYAWLSGAGAWAIKPGTRLTLENSFFYYNHADKDAGAAGADLSSQLNVVNCKFAYNTCVRQSAALQCNDGIMQVSHCIFHRNNSEDLSGGIYYYRSSGFVYNNTFYENSSDNMVHGAAVVINLSPGVDVERNIFSNQQGGGMGCPS